MPDFVTLTCPSCGGKLELPDNIGAAHCMFCGTKILLNPAETVANQQKLTHYRELRDVARKAGNCKEAIEYSNRILEIDPNDIESWITKAMAVCASSTHTDDRYEEGIEYLRQAARLAPDDERVTKEYDVLTGQQFVRYILLATQNTQRATELLQLGLDGTECLMQSMHFGLKAMSCVPGHFEWLEALETVAEAGAKIGIKWGSEVQSQLDTLASLRAKKAAEENLPHLRAELSELQSTLTKLKTQGGLFAGRKIKSTEAAIQKAQSEITSCEKAAVFEVPRPKL